MKKSDNAPRRPALRYYGSKWRLARWLLDFFPPHESYIEPFAGSAAVLLQKPRSWLEVLNDRDAEVVNFFRVLRDREDDLIRAIRLTPYALMEWEQSFEPAADTLEQARRFYVRAWMSINGPAERTENGWRRQKVMSRGRAGDKKMSAAAVTFMQVDHLHAVADRLRGVWIEQDDAMTIIERYDNPQALFYLDPPYPQRTRNRSGGLYAHEMSDDDHRNLADVLHRVEGMVILSGYRCELYEQLFGAWERFDQQSRINGPGYATESLWLNPMAVERRKHRDLPLFAKENIDESH